MRIKHDFGPLTFGFDIGIASVGWAVLGDEQLIDMGVRAFEAAEDTKGKPNNQTRRGARVSRNRYQMRTWRLKKLRRLFRDVNLLSSDDIKHLFSATRKKNQPQPLSPWALRAKALNESEPLLPQEWAQVLFYLVKHRGFKFFSKSEDPENMDTGEKTAASKQIVEQKEDDDLKDGLNRTRQLLDKYPQFHTHGNAAYQLAHASDKDPQHINGSYFDTDGNKLDSEDCKDFKKSLRNKSGSYRHAFRRDDLLSELAKLFDAQKKAGNPYVDIVLHDKIDRLKVVQISSETRVVGPTFRDQVFALLEMQHPPIYSNQMDSLIGDCELESETRNGKGKAERRAAKNSFSNERATWLQTLNNIRIKRNGKEEPLTPAERELLLALPYTQTKLTFKQAREALRTIFGFPAHWREASFTTVTYRNKRKDDGSWINVVAVDGTKTSLGKYGKDDIRKIANKKLKERLANGAMTFAELRQLFALNGNEKFEHQRKEVEIIPAAVEATYAIPDGKKTFVKLLPAKSRKSLILGRNAMKALADLTASNPNVTLAELRTSIENVEALDSGWQFEYTRKDTASISLEDEAATFVPIEYEDAQAAEEKTLIELKGWHAIKRALEPTHTDKWASLQVAYLEPQSDSGQAAAKQLDRIANVLTKAQTDVDVENGLISSGISESQVSALSHVRFKQYRNLSLTALQKILPYLEAGDHYSDACKKAGYKSLERNRTKYLPPLDTYLYGRIRHGKPTKHTELRYKDLTNPVVARAFNQARLVLNALIKKYDQSPAYVHVELARDIAKSKEKRFEETKRQEDNRNKRTAIRNNFIETYKINEPTPRQILKERLYQEQHGKCVYSQTPFLSLDLVLRDENYAQIDHIWPRSLTFDNSMENLVLVHAHANQDKGNRIPYNFIMQKYNEEHWRLMTAHVLGCKGMSDGKQKRLLSKELDTDEFSARNLVDTRYATRLFARLLRDHLLFDGQFEDKIEDIDPTESGKVRLDKFHKTRVRTPQGGVTAFLRRGWLGDVKNRALSDKHHALDACIVACCTPGIINEVNSYFANEERIPNRFKRNSDGTYTDKADGSGADISKKEARQRGLYLPPPWDSFRTEFLDKYSKVFVSRAGRKKRNNEVHGPNPLRQSQHYTVKRILLKSLTIEHLDEAKLEENYVLRNQGLLVALRSRLEQFQGNGTDAFSTSFFWPCENESETSAVFLPFILKKGKTKSVVKLDRMSESMTFKRVDITTLNLDLLSEKNLGAQYYRRNANLVDALRERLRQFNDNGEKAFKEPFLKPISKKKDTTAKWISPEVRKFAIPETLNTGVRVRGGVASLGDALFTKVYWINESYSFRPEYAAHQKDTFGLKDTPEGASWLFNITQNELIEAILKDGESIFGYFVMYEGDGRIQIRDHDRPGKGLEKQKSTDFGKPLPIEYAPKLYRFSVGKLASLRKYSVDVLGRATLIQIETSHGLA